MTFKVLIKQPWFQILVGLFVVLGLVLGIYYYGKSKGRGEASTAFQQRQADLLKKSQDAVTAADVSAKKALESEIYAEQLKKVIAGDRKTATDKEAQVTEVYQKSIEEINAKYEKDKNSIASMSDCDRCRDLCERTNQLAKYGPEFASYHCDPATECSATCSASNP